MSNRNDTSDFETQIIYSWHKNAEPWIGAIANNEIATRTSVTNQAIVNGIMKHKPSTVLDVGCGEGWLAVQLENLGVKVTGVDVVPELIERAQAQARGTFLVMSYQDLAKNKLPQCFDVVVCNFSLFGENSVESLLATVPSLLNPGGSLVIQTLPPSVAGLGEDESGWCQGSWQGFSDAFSDPAPWYCRSQKSWLALLNRQEFSMVEFEETKSKDSDSAVSLLITASV
ncbi:MAG: class I SAM-dependent methyltransferase [Pseudomonadales bacterium]|nr:class I SAM-dependent methyltransferase [Pseudomonadales bacterium]